MSKNFFIRRKNTSSSCNEKFPFFRNETWNRKENRVQDSFTWKFITLCISLPPNNSSQPWKSALKNFVTKLFSMLKEKLVNKTSIQMISNGISKFQFELENRKSHNLFVSQKSVKDQMIFQRFGKRGRVWGFKARLGRFAHSLC